MQKAREVTLAIGKGVYTVRTSLDDSVLDRVRRIIADACGERGVKGERQEDVLVLGILRTAYTLDAVTSVLGEVSKEDDTLSIREVAFRVRSLQ